jgi:hypothetical protein
MLKSGPPGIAFVDRRVDLQEIVVRPLANVAALAGNDAGGDSVAQAERIADGDDPIADPRRILGKGHKGIVALLCDLQQGEIGFGIRADDLCVQDSAVAQRHGDGRGVLDDVIVGDHVSL